MKKILVLGSSGMLGHVLSLFLKETGKNAHVFEVVYFTTMEQTLSDFLALREEINLAIISLLNQENIAFAAGSPNTIVVNISSGP